MLSWQRHELPSSPDILIKLANINGRWYLLRVYSSPKSCRVCIEAEVFFVNEEMDYQRRAFRWYAEAAGYVPHCERTCYWETRLRVLSAAHVDQRSVRTRLTTKQDCRVRCVCQSELKNASTVHGARGSELDYIT